MIQYHCFQLLIVLIACANVFNSIHQKRIIGGEEAPPDKYRWAVSIKGNVDQLKVSGSCGASIINTGKVTQWLITAAHCFYPSNKINLFNLTKADLWHARVGITKVDFAYQKHGFEEKIMEKFKLIFNKAFRKMFGKNGFEIDFGDLHVGKIFIHPDYKPISPKTDFKKIQMNNDIALMKLKERLPVDDLPGVSAIDLPNDTFAKDWPPLKSKCSVVGWGCTAPRQKAHPIAKIAVLKIRNSDECKKVTPTNLFLNTTTEFCAGYYNKSYGLCQGDSGSGLFCDHKGIPTIAGIVSRGHGGRPGDYPSVFTKILSFNAWIRDTIEKN